MDRADRGSSSASRARTRGHLVGLSEHGMTGLAQWLALRGLSLSGTEPEPVEGPALAALRRLGVRAHAGHSPHHYAQNATFLIHGEGIGREHPDRLVAAREGVAQATAIDWLGRLMQARLGLSVVGGREASVTSAMIAWTLARAGFDPSAVIGRAAPQLGGWGRLGHGPHFVIEALETPDALGPPGPRVAVLLGTSETRGSDGVDATELLRRFAASVPTDGRIFATRDCPRVSAAVLDAVSPVEWLSLEERDGWWGSDLREEKGRYRFRAFHRGRFAVEVKLQVPGRRHVLSALAAIAACGHLDVPSPEIKEGLEEFSGLSRDFESRGSYRGVTLVDDEGRDAPAVAEALAVGRQVFGPRRLWAVYGPRQEGLTPDDAQRYLSAFGRADRVLIQTRRPPEPDVRPGWETLAHHLSVAGVGARWVASLEEAIAELDRDLEPGDVLVTLGAGEVGTISDAFIRRLSRDRQGR
ncbi:MAG: Mur ligase domain-containing protein [Isosphaeraceae bacterium]|nr:Mur ligase domain-containing protein [Isosphaeraceae bacterium]